MESSVFVRPSITADIPDYPTLDSAARAICAALRHGLDRCAVIERGAAGDITASALEVFAVSSRGRESGSWSTSILHDGL